MKAEQLSVFLENKPGRLAEVTHILAEGEINIRALAVADTLDFGVLRLITDHPEKARTILADKGFMAQVTDVLAVEVPDRPGGLHRILAAFHQGGINVEYMYTLVTPTRKGVAMIFRLDDLDKGLAVITPDIGRPIAASELRGY